MYKQSLFSILLILNSNVFYPMNHDEAAADAINLVENAAKALVVNAQNAPKYVQEFIKKGTTPDLTNAMGDYPIFNGDESIGVAGVQPGLTSLVNSFKNGSIHLPDALDPMGQYPHVNESELESSNWMKPCLKSLNDSASKVFAYTCEHARSALNSSAELESNSGFHVPSMQEQAWYNKAWNAEVAGYKDGGKYIIVGTSVVATAVLTAYLLGCFDKKATVEKMVDTLIEQAQKNPNIVLAELPKILELCKNEQMKQDVLKKVLANVVMTPEIQKEFSC